MTTATEDSQAMVEIPFDLLSALAALAALAAFASDGAELSGYGAHEIRDALAELCEELNRIETGTVKAWGMDPEHRNLVACNLVDELMERAGHGGFP